VLYTRLIATKDPVEQTSPGAAAGPCGVDTSRCCTGLCSVCSLRRRSGLYGEDVCCMTIIGYYCPVISRYSSGLKSVELDTFWCSTGLCSVELSECNVFLNIFYIDMNFFSRKSFNLKICKALLFFSGESDPLKIHLLRALLFAYFIKPLNLSLLRTPILANH
jgi:hypothetical protein